MAVELATNCAVVFYCLSGHTHHGLAQNQRQGASAQTSRPDGVCLQSRNDGGSCVGSIRAAGKNQNENGDRPGRRVAARMAASAKGNRTVHAIALSAPVFFGRTSLQRIFDAAKEWLSPELRVCR